MSRSFSIRLRIIASLVLLAGALFIWRLYDLQVRRSAEFLEEAKKQYVATIPNIYRRGNIYFTEKDGKLTTGATVNEGYVISINPALIQDKAKVYQAISGKTLLDEKLFLVNFSAHSKTLS